MNVHRKAGQPSRQQADHDTDQPARTRQRRRLDEKLLKDVATRCANRLPNPDLTRPIRDRDHHHRHHPDPAHQQRHRRQRHHYQEENSRNLIERVENLILRDQIEAVVIRRP